MVSVSDQTLFPDKIPNWVGGEQVYSISESFFEKINPANGEVISRVTRSQEMDVSRAVGSAKSAQEVWSEVPPVQRGMILHKVVRGMQDNQAEIAKVVSLETGKSFKDAYGETGGAIQLGLFYASEGQRLYGRTTTSGIPNRQVMVFRQPIGVAGLIVPANTPIANVAWKVFPALICGNTAVLKAAEDTPITAWIFGKIVQEAGLPPGVLNIIQGYGEEAGAPLVAHQDVGVISFTGSTEVGRIIQRVAGDRFAKVSLELGGKNPFIVCDDADLENAVKWALLSAFSNAGQRCASGTRLIVFDGIYNQFKQMLIDQTQRLRVGPGDDDDFGPVINEAQLNNMLVVLDLARREEAEILIGGYRLMDDGHKNGFYMAPTLVENTDSQSELSLTELFGPIAILYRVNNLQEALSLANDSPYGLTAAVHTRSIHRAIQFIQKIQAGVASINAGTYGSEPHMPFGGVKQSGNGSREPGTEALDVYSYLKDVYINFDPQQV